MLRSDRLGVRNPFTAMISLENDQNSAKSETLKPFFLLFFHSYVNEPSSKRIALKVYGLKDRKLYHFKDASVWISAQKFYRLGQWWY